MVQACHRLGLVVLAACLALSCGHQAAPGSEAHGLAAVAQYSAPVHPSSTEFEQATESGRWLLPTGEVPLLVTALGDAFVRSPDGKVYFLDTESGEFTVVATSTAEWERLLDRPEVVEQWFRPGFVDQLKQRYSPLSPPYVFSPTIPLVLSGKLTIENYTPSRWDAHLHVLGQIHRQVKDLAPGTPITEIKVDPW